MPPPRNRSNIFNLIILRFAHSGRDSLCIYIYINIYPCISIIISLLFKECIACTLRRVAEGGLQREEASAEPLLDKLGPHWRRRRCMLSRKWRSMCQHNLKGRCANIILRADVVEKSEGGGVSKHSSSSISSSSYLQQRLSIEMACRSNSSTTRRTDDS